jgi:membrane protease YdiL (CAAX protease family)
LKDLGKILLYFISVIALGALLAPPLYWAGQAVAARGMLTFLAETDFQKFFNRGALIAALALIWPTIKWLQIGSVKELGLERDPRGGRRFAFAFIAAGLCVAVLAAVYLEIDIYRWKKKLEWGKIPPLLLSAMVVSILEEVLFRAGILGLFRRTLRPWPAIFLTSAIFSAVHFLKPDEQVKVTQVDWLTGFAMVPHTFHKFGEPLLMLGGFTTIWVLGVILGDITVRTRSLWAPIGFHAGLIFIKMSFSKLTKRDSSNLPWIGEELQIGLVPILALALGWLFYWLWLRTFDARTPSPRD